jgi:PadR family transcriptional regulator AphA
MSLRYAILGQLGSGPHSGYDLALYLDGTHGGFWFATHSQIYPELRRLEQEGLIVGAPTTVGEKLEKRVYEITPAGRAALEEWAASPPVYKPIRDPERLQLIFADRASVAAIRRHLEVHRDRFIRERDRMESLREEIASRRHQRVESRLAGRTESEKALSLTLRELAYGGERDRAALEVRWAERGLELLEEFESRHDTPSRS